MFWKNNLLSSLGMLTQTFVNMLVIHFLIEPEVVSKAYIPFLVMAALLLFLSAKPFFRGMMIYAAVGGLASAFFPYTPTIHGAWSAVGFFTVLSFIYFLIMEFSRKPSEPVKVKIISRVSLVEHDPSEKKICRYCGRSNKKDADYCSGCGAGI